VKRKALAGPKLNVDAAKLSQLQEERRALASKKAAAGAVAAMRKRTLSALLIAPPAAVLNAVATAGELGFAW